MTFVDEYDKWRLQKLFHGERIFSKMLYDLIYKRGEGINFISICCKGEQCEYSDWLLVTIL